MPEPPKKRTGKKVAVIGSGPAGLCAAAQLNKAGHLVTVFERADRPGGLLMYGIPNMKLDKNEVVLRRIKLLEAEGIKFVCNTEVGKNYPAEKLLKEFDAVILATGATKPRDLPIRRPRAQGHPLRDGFSHREHQERCWTAQERQFHCRRPARTSSSSAAATPARTASAPRCATAARALVQVEILPKPPLERAKDNPWPEWPKVYKLDYGQEEAAAKFGADPRVYLTTATKFEGDANGHVKAVHTVQVEWDEERQGPVHSRRTFPARKKFCPRNSSCWRWVSSDRNSRCSTRSASNATRARNAKAEFEKYTTNIKGVFAAGDCRRGQSLVVWAFNEGRGAARECDRYLMGATDLP